MAVATALAIGGLAVSAGSTAMSFVQAGKQNKLQREAQAKAAQAMAEARKKLEVNFAEQRSIQKEPYELAREAILSTGAQAIQAGVESDRGAEVTAGKVQMAMNQGQADIRTAMGQELTDIEKDIINEDSRLRDLNVQLDLGEVEGAQLAARDAQEASAAATMQGFQGLESMGQQALDMVPLYKKTNTRTPVEGLKPMTTAGTVATPSPFAAKNQAPTEAQPSVDLYGKKQPSFRSQKPYMYNPFGVDFSSFGGR
jgi:hypothetical protein